MSSNKILALVALALVGLLQTAQAEVDGDLIERLFGEDSPALEPLETERLLHQLEELYVSQDTNFDNIDDDEKVRRLVVYSVVRFGELSERSCTQEHFGKLQRHIQYIEHLELANIQSYLEYSMQRQLELCLSRDANFEFKRIGE